VGSGHVSYRRRRNGLLKSYNFLEVASYFSMAHGQEIEKLALSHGGEMIWRGARQYPETEEEFSLAQEDTDRILNQIAKGNPSKAKSEKFSI